MTKKGELAGAILLTIIAIAAIYTLLTVPSNMKTPTGMQTLEPKAIINLCNQVLLPGSKNELGKNLNCTTNEFGVYMNGDNIELDCKGYWIRGINQASRYGIVSSGTPSWTNITIKNCQIFNWTRNIHLQRVNGGSITNSTIFNASGTTRQGIYFDDVNDTIITNNTIYGTPSTYYGIYVDTGSRNITITHNTLSKNTLYGIYVTQTNIGNISSNEVYDSKGIYLGTSHNFAMNNNYIHDSTTAIGITLSSADNNTLINNTARNLSAGIIMTSAKGNTIENCTLQENAAYDFSISANADAECNNRITNINGSAGRPINYTNETVTWQNFEAAEIVLCNADNSVIENVTVNGSDTHRNNLAHFLRTDNTIARNITSSENRYGIQYVNSNNNTLEDSTANTNANYGMVLSSSADNRLISNTANNNTWHGLIISTNSDRNNITNNTAQMNAWDGINIDSSSGNRLTNNTATGNTESGIEMSATNTDTLTGNNASDNQQYGIYINGGTETLIGNHANNNTLTGIYVVGTGTSTLEDNTANKNQVDGIYLNVWDSNVTGNTANNNTIHGISLDIATNNNLSNNNANNNTQNGIKMLTADNNIIMNNTANYNTANGILIETSSNNNVRDNTLRHNTADGLYLEDTAFASTNNTLEANTLCFNGDDGIDLSDDANYTSIIGNNASDNTDKGFMILGLYMQEFKDNTANNNHGAGTGGDIGPITYVEPVSTCTPSIPCDTDEDCGTGECDTFNNAPPMKACDCGVLAPPCGPGNATPDTTACFPIFDGGWCDRFMEPCIDWGGGQGCCGLPPNGPDSLPTFQPMQLSGAFINITNNTANNNNGTGWIFNGFNNTNFIDNTANNNTVGIEFRNTTNSYIEGTTAENNTLAQIYLNLSTNNQFFETKLRTNGTWITTDGSTGNNATNTTFNSTDGKIFYNTTLELPDATTLTNAHLNITYIKAYANSTMFNFLNKSSIITFRGLATKPTSILVDFQDDGTYETCPAGLCTEISWAPPEYTFGAAHWTTFSAQFGAMAINITLNKTDEPDPVNVSQQLNYTITINITSGNVTNLTATETYPIQITYQTASPTPNISNNIWQFGNISAPRVIEINITTLVNAGVANGTIINNTINVTFQNATGTLFNITETINTTVLNPGGPAPTPTPSGGGGSNSMGYLPTIIPEEKENKTETKKPEPPKQEMPQQTRRMPARTGITEPEEEIVKVKRQTVAFEILKPATIAALVLGILAIFIYAAWRIHRPKDIEELTKELEKIQQKLKK